MAIEIIDGFRLNSSSPVDDRIVASGSSERNLISYKYEGLRVFDTYDGIPYVWLNNTWKKENDTALSVPNNITLGFSQSTNYKSGQILKVYNDQKLMTNSNMFEVEYQTGKTIAINYTNPSSVSSNVQLDVNGVIKATTLQGQLDASNITGKLPITNIAGGTDGTFLKSTTSGLTWVAVTTGVNTQYVQTTDTNIHYLTFVKTVGNDSQLLTYQRSSSDLIGVNPSSGQLLVGPGTSLLPSYSFIGNTNTGIYKSTTGLGISVLGSEKVDIDSIGIKVSPGTVTNPGFSFIGGSNHGIYQGSTTVNTSFITYNTYYRVGLVVNSSEVIRINSKSSVVNSYIPHITPDGQGYGYVNIYGDASTLNLYGVSSTYISFYQTGADNTTLTPNRGAQLGFESSTNNNFVINNQSTGNYIKLLGTNVTQISANGVEIYSNKVGDFGLFTQNTNSNGLGIAVKDNNGEGLRLASGSTGTNFLTFYDNTQTTINPDWGARTAWIGHFPSVGGNNVLNISHELSNGQISHKINGTEKMSISSNGVSIGGGSVIRRVICGVILAQVNGSTPTVLAGSGFTVTMSGSFSSMRATITFNVPFLTNNFSIQVTSVDGSTTTTCYPYNWLTSSFDIVYVGYSSGSLQTHFTVTEIV